jgi:hypothetical protein
LAPCSQPCPSLSYLQVGASEGYHEKRVQARSQRSGAGNVSPVIAVRGVGQRHEPPDSSACTESRVVYSAVEPKSRISESSEPTTAGYTIARSARLKAISRLGNIGSASLPVAWASHQACEPGYVAWTAVGAGLTWGAALSCRMSTECLHQQPPLKSGFRCSPAV